MPTDLALVFTVINQRGSACAVVNIPRHAAILVDALGPGSTVTYDSEVHTKGPRLVWKSDTRSSVDDIAEHIVGEVYAIADKKRTD